MLQLEKIKSIWGGLVKEKYMLKVKTYVSESKIHGKGLFSKQFIPKGTIVWKFDPDSDIVITKDDWDYIIKKFKKLIIFMNIEQYSWKDEDNIYICIDDCKYMNHSETNNLSAPIKNTLLVANRNIEIGEELTENYYEFGNQGVDNGKQF